MGIGKILYQDLPKAISAIRQIGSINKVNSRGLGFKLVSDNWITKYRVRTFNEKEPEMLDWVDGNHGMMTFYLMLVQTLEFIQYTLLYANQKQLFMPSNQNIQI